MFSFLRTRALRVGIVGGLITTIGAAALITLTQTPSNDRAWNEDQLILPEITFTDPSTITIRNIRNFDYTSTSTWTPRYYDRTIKLTDVATVDFMLEPFGTFGAAHTLVSFGLTDGTYIAVSAEIRKEIGEQFSPLKGLFRSYELMYVIADERDVIKLRANYRKHDVYLYPTEVSPEQAQRLFISMMQRAQGFQNTPEFYNTITNNCIINITRHINTLNPNRVPWDHRLIFPANADVYAQSLGLIAKGMRIEEAREKYHINERALEHADDPEFSKRIRE